VNDFRRATSDGVGMRRGAGLSDSASAWPATFGKASRKAGEGGDWSAGA